LNYKQSLTIHLTHDVISETSLSWQLIALLLTTNKREYYWVQLWYTIQQRTVLIICLTTASVHVLSIGWKGRTTCITQ